jgi:nitrilase
VPVERAEVEMTHSIRVAIVQRPPVTLDRTATMKRVIEGIDEAAGDGARLVVFPETYVPGYPEYIWRLRPGDSHDYHLSRQIHARLMENAVDLDADDLAPVREAAEGHGMVVMLGVHELDGRFSRATLYNTLVTIGPDGSVLNRHRKLVPTNPERMVWAQGDATGLRVTSTPLGRIGGLICWENYMPLARFALYAQGIDIYVAPTWDEGDTWLASLRHIAKEGRCWVLGAGCAVQAAEIPDDFPDRDRLYPDPDEWLNSGDSVVIDPAGRVVAGPLHGEHGILTADIDVAEAKAAHYTLDPAGHYNRPDVFQLTVDRTARPQVEFDDPEPTAMSFTGQQSPG